jgi:hypothetical protein
MAGQTSIDDREPRSILNQVAVDDIGADAVQTGCEPHRIISFILRIATQKAVPPKLRWRSRFARTRWLDWRVTVGSDNRRAGVYVVSAREPGSIGSTRWASTLLEQPRSPHRSVTRGTVKVLFARRLPITCEVGECSSLNASGLQQVPR